MKERQTEDLPQGEVEPAATMSLTGHLDELRNRILLCLGALLATFLFCFAVSDRIMALFAARAPGIRFVFTSPTEPFFTSLRVAILSALVLAFPMILAQGWAFCRPGLKDGERRMIRWIIPWTVCLFATGCAVAYSGLPLFLRLLLRFAGGQLQAMLSIRLYTTFALTSMLVMGLIFQIPLVLTVAAKLGLINSTVLRKHRIPVIIGTFTVAMLLTPPDILSQIVVAVPVLGLYEITILLLSAAGR